MPHSRTLASVVLCILGAVNAPTSVAADDAAYEFNLPQQSLADALRAIGRQTAMNILFEPETVENVTAPAVRGRLSAMEAVHRLLAGTQLSAEQTAANALLIRTATADEKETTSALLPGPSHETAQPDAAKEPPDGAREQSPGWFRRLRLAQGGPASRADASSSEPGDSAERSSDSPPLTPVRLDNLPEILVKGSRSLNIDIQRTRDDPQPYVTFDREKITQSGAPNLETFLRDRLPMNTTGVPNGQRVTQAGNQSTFNLRGLGANQTLILIDGHRASPGPSYGGTPRQTDINSIPVAAVERIEVLPATASGIYGGNATGGVINIILRHDYQGAEVKATYGNTFASDVGQRRFDASTGFSLEGGKTNVLLIASYSDQNALRLQERPELVERYYATARANSPALLVMPPLGATPNIRSADGSSLVLDSGVSLNSPSTFVPDGYAGAASDGGAALLANAGQYNLGLPSGLQQLTGGDTVISQAPRNIAVRSSVHREFSPSVRAFLEGSFSESETFSRWLVTNGSSASPYRVSGSAPNNPFAGDILVTVPTDSLATYMDGAIRHARAIGGVIVSLPASWQAEMDYTWSRTRDGFTAQQILPGADMAAVMTGAVDVLRDTRTNPIDLSSLVTYADADTLQEVTFKDVALRLAGPVMDLPAGPINVSTLFEYRTEKYADTTQNVAGISLLYPSRSADISSIYVETRIPLVSAKNAKPGVQDLELQLAARADEYRSRGKTGFVIVGTNTPVVSASNETSSVNPTVALRYQPIPDLVFRTSYGTGFIAPDVSQLAGNIGLGTITIADPRRGGSQQTLAIGQVLQGGNANLGPEESDNFSVGFIFTPRFLPQLRLSLDYTRIEKTDNIASYPTGIQGIVNDEAQLPAGRVQRGPNLPGDPAGWAGPITLLDDSLFNIARAEVEAFDLQLDYQWFTDFGTFGFSTVATRQTHYLTQSLPDQPTLENVGVAFNNPLGLTGSAELKWQRAGWTAGWVARYFDDYLVANPAVPTNAGFIALQGNGGRVPSQTYHDVFVNWRPEAFAGGVGEILQDTEFQLSVRNVFDKMPPFEAFLYSVLGTYHSTLADPLGASYQLSVTKRF